MLKFDQPFILYYLGWNWIRGYLRDEIGSEGIYVTKLDRRVFTWRNKAGCHFKFSRSKHFDFVSSGHRKSITSILECLFPARYSACPHPSPVMILDKDNGNMDSASDSEIENPETVDDDNEVDAADEETDTGPSTNQRDITCRICLDNACDAILLPCGHASCHECGEILKREKKDCHICRGRIRRVQRMFLN